jgi:hypothetical protein
MLAFGITEPALGTMYKLIALVTPDDWFTACEPKLVPMYVPAPTDDTDAGV